jgi:hypothetical protein
MNNHMEPTHVFHYTDAAGFLAITKSRTVWASCVECLNDEKEFRHGLDVAGQMAHFYNREEVPYAQERLVAFLDILSRLWGMAIFSCSFSAQQDLLSQWRGYCGSGNGYNIGFGLEIMKRFCEKNDYVFRKCIYDRAEQENVLRPIVQKLFEGGFDNYTIDSGHDRLVNASEQAAYIIREYAAFFKDHAFKEEEEWRLVAYVYNHEDPRWSIRPGKTSLIPYIKVDLSSAEGIISQVTIGPGPFDRMKLFHITASHNLNARLGHIQINTSNVPYRFW